jgi:hypothetical protein
MDTKQAQTAEHRIAGLEAIVLSQRILARYLRNKYKGFASIAAMSDAELLRRHFEHGASIYQQGVSR